VSVRTARIATGNSGPANTGKTIYTVPAEATVIVKDIRLAAQQSAVTSVLLGIDSGPTFTTLLSRDVPQQGTSLAPDVWLALEPGDRLTLVCSVANGCNYYVSGTILAGVNPL